MEILEVSSSAGSTEIQRLLELLAWRGTTDHLEHITAPYANDARLFAAFTEGRPIGVIGLKGSEPGFEVIAIAVEERSRGSGIGRLLLDHASQLRAGATIWAETDEEGVGFYRSCGFEVESLGERYPGVERFRCTR